VPPSSSTTLPAYDDIERAARQIDGVAHRTPVVTSRIVDARTRARVFFKCENFQRAGAFKFRGVVAFSSGNHAQAVALAGQLLDIPRVIVMPTDSPAVKRAATSDYGAEIVLYDREREDREAIGRKLADERGLAVIPPYNHHDIVAGAGTAARELIAETGPLDLLLVPCGGGGLLSGCALAARHLSPQCRVIGVEPAAGDDATRSFKTKTLQTVKNPDTIADGARTPSLGKVTYPLVMRYVDDMLTVTDAELLKSMFFLWERMKIVVEPTGALAACALLERKLDAKGKRVGVVLSGGNADVKALAAML
jgi:threonine dehydratase